MNFVKRYWYFHFLLLLKIGPKWCFSLFIRVVESTAQILVFWLSKWRSIWSGRSILLLFGDSSREPRLRNLLLYASLLKKATANQTAGEITGLRPSKIAIISFAYPIRRSCLSSTKTYRRRILALLLRLKALFLFIWKNFHHNFEWFISNIFENWMRKLVIKPCSITSKNFEICKNLKWKECDNTCTII